MTGKASCRLYVGCGRTVKHNPGCRQQRQTGFRPQHLHPFRHAVQSDGGDSQPGHQCRNDAGNDRALVDDSVGFFLLYNPNINPTPDPTSKKKPRRVGASFTGVILISCSLYKILTYVEAFGVCPDVNICPIKPVHIPILNSANIII